MKAIILALIPVAGFVIGVYMGRMNRDGRRNEKRMAREHRVLQDRLDKAEDLIDDLSVMASEHATLGEPMGVLAQEQITLYRRGAR